jgi:hypothetical protein
VRPALIGINDGKVSSLARFKHPRRADRLTGAASTSQERVRPRARRAAPKTCRQRLTVGLRLLASLAFDT